MEFDKELIDYTSAYSLYMLISDLAYSKETKGRLLDINKEDVNIYFRMKKKENGEAKFGNEEKYEREAKKGCSLLGLIQKFYPENCMNNTLDGKNGKNDVAPIVCATRRNLEARPNVKRKINKSYYELIIETLADEIKYEAWREKIKTEIKKWGFDDSQMTEIVDNVIFKLYMSPKFYFKKDSADSDDTHSVMLKYATRSIFEIIDINGYTGEVIQNINKDTYKKLKCDDLLMEEYDSEAQLTSKKYKQNLYENMIFKYRMDLNRIISEGGLYILYDNGYSIEEDIANWNPMSKDNRKLTRLESNIYAMRKEPIELITSMIIFSICVQLFVLKRGQLYVDESTKTPLLFKLFVERNINCKIDLKETYDENKNVDKMLEILVGKIVDVSNFNVLETKERLIDDYISCIRKIYGWNVYDSDNKYCFVNAYISDLPCFYANEVELNKNNLLKAVFNYYKKNKSNLGKWEQYYYFAIIKYARYIFDNHIKSQYGDLEAIIKMFNGKSLISVEYDRLCADIYRKGIEEIYCVDKDFEKAYFLYKKVFSITKQTSMIEDCILPCLNEWLIEVDNAKAEEIVRWKELWETAIIDNGIYGSIYEKFNEKCYDELKSIIKEIQYKYDIKNMEIPIFKNSPVVSIPEDAEDIYIVLGAGKASQTFISSVIGKNNCHVLLVLQENELEKITSLKVWYEESNIKVMTKGLSEVFASLELYNLMSKCKDDETVFKDYFLNGVKKLHFMALDKENKESNLANVVEIINQSYTRYKLYNLLADVYTNIKFDFSEVDITIDSQAQTAWYLDSVINRFEDEFYLKINHISMPELVSRELLTEYPLFLTDVNELKKCKGVFNNTGRHDIAILGSDIDLIPVLVKYILQISGYMRNDKIEDERKDYLNDAIMHNYANFEAILGKDVSVSVLSPRASEIKNIIMYDAPDLLNDKLKCIHVIPEFYDINVCSGEFVKLFSECNELNAENKILQIVQKTNYFIVATENTEKSIELAMKIRTLRYRNNVLDKPVISVFSPLCNQDEKINQFTVGNKVYEDAWYRSYDINMFGKYQNIYSRENLFENLFDKISIELHLDDDFNKAKKKKRDYYKILYNHRSCNCRALAIIYGFYSVFGTSMVRDFSLSKMSEENLENNRWSMALFTENLGKYLEEYNKKIRPDDNGENGWVDIMAVLEHNRWNIMMMSEGYTGYLRPNQCNADIEKIIKSWADYSPLSSLSEQNERMELRDNKLHIAKIHFAIRPFDELGDRIGLDTFYHLSQNSEGVIRMKIKDGTIKDSLAMNEIDRIRKRINIEAYEELVQIINDYLKLSENEFERKWLSVQAILNDNNIDELLHEIKREWKEDYTVLKGDKFEVFMNEIGVIDEISRFYEKISLERYRKLLSMSKDYVELSTKDFIEKWGKVQISIGIDKFELLMDQIGNKITGFKTAKNRQYDRQYAYNVAKSLERVLNENIVTKLPRDNNMQLERSTVIVTEKPKSSTRIQEK